MGTIMVVDDSAVMRKIVARTIRQAGYGDHDIVEAEDGADALEAIRDDAPTLVLSDWNMPDPRSDSLFMLRLLGLALGLGMIVGLAWTGFRSRR